MRKKITSFTFCLLLLIFFVLVIILPKDEKASEKENRPLATMPEFTIDNLLYGSFTKDYESFLTDNVGYRSYFMDFGGKLESLKGMDFQADEKVLTLPSGGQLVLSSDRIMEVYRENLSVKTSYIDALSEIFSKVDANKYIMLVPTQLEFSDSAYRNYSDSQKYAIELIYASLPDVLGINVYDSLKENTDDYIYFRTDHHWTQDGAYLGYREIMKAIGEEPLELDSFKKNTLKGFLGFLYNQANIPEYKEFKDDINYYTFAENPLIYAKIREEDGRITNYQSRVYLLPKKDASPNYGIFMGSDHPIATVKTKIKNGKTLLVIKDSYANALLPFLTNHFENLVIVDPRSYFGTIDDLTSEYNITDMIVINYCLSTTLQGYADALHKIK